MQLRQYQKDILNKLYKSLSINNSCILSLPTGAGKTIMMLEWAKKMASSNKKTLIIINREELALQTKNKAETDVSVLKAGYDELFNPNSLIQIVMLQTAYSRQNILLDLDFNYIFFDEYDQYYDGLMFNVIVDIFKNAKKIYVSATPISEKGYLLGNTDDYINDLQTQDLIDMGYLIKPNYYTLSNYSIDLSDVRIVNGDFATDEIDNIMLDYNRIEQIFVEYIKVAKDRKTIAFCTSIKQAEKTCNYFKNMGVKCACLHSKSNNRKEVLEAFRNNDINIIFNVGILVAGFDEPSTDCIMFLNPTKILRRYIQQAGRGLRLYDGKSDCLMLDFAGHVTKHGFCNDYRFFKKEPEKEVCNLKGCPSCGQILEKHIKICTVCSYEFSEINQETNGKKQTKKQIESLMKAKSLQEELKKAIEELGKERNYKRGWAWFLFKDVLKLKRPTESSLQFFKRKMSKIKKAKERSYNPNCLRYE